jgi:hypothetical protein
MKKLCGLPLLIIFFFSIKSFGGSRPSFPVANKSSAGPVSLTKDTIKKVADTASSDNDDDDDGTDTMRSYAIGLDGGNDQSSHGIHSGSRTPYVEPNFTYTAPKGFYTIVQDCYYLMGKGKGYNIFGIDPGWNIDLYDDATLNANWTHNFLGSAAARKLPSQDISNIPETYFSQNFGETECRFTIDYDMYSNTSRVKTPNDWIFTPDLNHTFKIRIGEKKFIELIPEASYDCGTRNAATHFAVNNGDTTRINKSGKGASFGSLDYNLILTVDLKIHHFEFEPAINLTQPLYAIPGQSDKSYGYVTVALIHTIY